MPPAAAAAHSAQASKAKSKEQQQHQSVGDGVVSEISSSDQTEPEHIADTLPLQSRVRTAYNTNLVQISVAVLIFANFLISAADKQLNAQPGSSAWDVFYAFELFFAAVFGVELVWNMYGLWFRFFWKSCVVRTRASRRAPARSPASSRRCVRSLPGFALPQRLECV